MTYLGKFITCTTFLLFLGIAAHADATKEDSLLLARAEAEPIKTQSAALDGLTLQGTVLETMNSAGYTYLLLDAKQGKIWVAIPETSLSTGQTVICSPGITMKNFESKTLQRRFETILFSPGLIKEHEKTAAASASDEVHQKNAASFNEALQAEQAATHSSSEPFLVVGESPGSSGAIVPLSNVNVNKAAGPNSYSVAECFEQAKDLNGKTVRVRGKVMKVSRMIMGKNWLHIQDGTGNPLKNQHDLVVTTMADPAEHAVITVEGILHANRDFGAGYKYEAIIEDAQIE